MHSHIIDQFNRNKNRIVSYVYNNCLVCSAPHLSSRLGKLFPWHISSCRLASRARFTLCVRFVQRAWTLAYLALPPSLLCEDAVLLRFCDTLTAAPSEGFQCRGRRSWLEVSDFPSFPRRQTVCAGHCCTLWRCRAEAIVCRVAKKRAALCAWHISVTWMPMMTHKWRSGVRGGATA